MNDITYLSLTHITIRTTILTKVISSSMQLFSAAFNSNSNDSLYLYYIYHEMHSHHILMLWIFMIVGIHKPGSVNPDCQWDLVLAPWLTLINR